MFPGSWSLEAAETVCSGDGIEREEMVDLLSSLISKSLVMADSECAGGRRYRLLETVRQYARERLVQVSAAERLRERHFEFFFNEFRGALPVLSRNFWMVCCRVSGDCGSSRKTFGRRSIGR